MPIFTRYQSKLKKSGIHSFIPDDQQYKLRGKDKLKDVADKIGIQIPETRVIHSIEELYETIDVLGFPLMIKGAFYKAYQSYTTQEAIHYFHTISAEWGLPIIVQQVVKGDEMNVMGVGDGKGGLIGQIAIKKLSITPLGKIWTGVTINHEAILNASKRFVEAYNWKGPFELESIVTDSFIYLIEINPRFPAWSYFATGVGMNLPGDMIRYALGTPVKGDYTYEPGKLFIRYTYETICSLDAFQNIMIKGEN
jgi:carbamoyl-phosphate synthase large subunit